MIFHPSTSSLSNVCSIHARFYLRTIYSANSSKYQNSQILQRSNIHTSSNLLYEEYNNPRFSVKKEWSRVWDILQHDWRRVKRRLAERKYDYYKRKDMRYPVRAVMQYELWPVEADYFVVGGGLMGSSVAWWLKQRSRDEDSRVVVVESDETFAQNATSLSLGAIRVQHSNPELVEMSLFGAEFLRNAGEHLRILDSEPPKIDFTPMGHLFLCDNEEKAKRMEDAVKMQTEIGAKVAVFNRDELKMRFPFLNVDDILIGTMGLENEGIVDAWQLLSAFREKNVTFGVQYVKAKVAAFEYEKVGDITAKALFGTGQDYRFARMSNAVLVPEMVDAAPRPCRTSIVFNCGGPWAGEVAQLAGIGLGESRNFMSVPIPVEKRKRYVFVVHCPNGPGLDMPFVIDPSGVWCRRDSVNGSIYLCGKRPTEEEDEKIIDHSNLDVDYNFFDERIWPVLAKRIPAFECLKVKNAWAGYYDYNYFDGGPIIGEHIANERFYTLAGFNGTGLQHAIAAGRAAMERYHDGAYIEIALRRFGVARMMMNKKIEEDIYVI